MRRSCSRVAALLSLCLVSAAVAGEETKHDLPAQAKDILQRYCWTCHQGDGTESSGAFDVTNYSDLRSADKAARVLVVPDRPDESLLLERIVSGEMPPEEAAERPSKDEIEILRQWIASGAEAFAGPQQREFIPLVDVLTKIRNHMRDADRAKQPYLRYFTLHNIHNDRRVADKALPLYRAALSKALNSLSRAPEIVRPTAIDDGQLLFVIDLRDYDWDGNNGWQEIIQRYPYGFSYGQHRDATLRDLSEDIAELSNCSLPYVRADWFIATATRPPLYHKLLDIPQTVDELESQLGVDLKAGFQQPLPARIARAGFAKSGISGQQRVVERHRAKGGSVYWRSYDFMPDNALGKLARFPLGPLSVWPKGTDPRQVHSFEHDGGEMIYRLANGMQAYMLIDRAGKRIDEAPIQVVSDPLKTSGTPVIVNGISCIACHKHGMRWFQDTVRNSAVINDSKVQDLYVSREEMDQLLKADEKKFLEALEETIGPFVRVGADKDKPIEDFPEPISEVSRLYRLIYLDFATVASELDVPDAKTIEQEVGRHGLRALGLESLLNGGVVSRQDWEARHDISLMQELGKKLRYSPYWSVSAGPRDDLPEAK